MIQIIRCLDDSAFVNTPVISLLIIFLKSEKGSLLLMMCAQVLAMCFLDGKVWWSSLVRNLTRMLQASYA
jgi:hypothetical protein